MSEETSWRNGRRLRHWKFTLLRHFCREESKGSNTSMPLHVSNQVRAIPSITHPWDTINWNTCQWLYLLRRADNDWKQCTFIDTLFLLIGDLNKTSLAKSTIHACTVFELMRSKTSTRFFYCVLLGVNRALEWNSLRSVFSQSNSRRKKTVWANLQTFSDIQTHNLQEKVRLLPSKDIGPPTR